MRVSTRKIVVSAIVGSLYAALTMLLAPISYGDVQCRVSEVLCILPFFIPSTAIGLFLGCVIANLMSVAGILDIVFGSLATLLAAICTARLGKGYRERGVTSGVMRCAAACSMPVLFNGPIIGAVLAVTFTPDAFWAGFLIMGAQVALGEAAVMFVLGFPLMRYLPKLKFFNEFIGKL